MNAQERVNILLVDDQQAKLLSHEAILAEIGENLLKASSASQAFECLLKNEIALVLIDVCMPDLDGFELAAMIREHPRFETTAIIFVSAVMMTYPDQLRGYQLGGVDYVFDQTKRDYFLGLQLRFTDDDLKTILPFAGGAVSGASSSH